MRPAANQQFGIALVVHALIGGGTERVVSTLANAWAAELRPVTVITLGPEEDDFFALSSDVQRIVVGGSGEARGFLTGLIANCQRITRLRAALRRSKARTVVSFLTPTNILIILATLGLGVRIVVSERNDTVRQDLGWPWRILRRSLYRFATVVTANTVHSIDDMSTYVPRQKLAHVPNSVELPSIRVEATERQPIVLNVARLAPHKRQDLLIDAFARLGERFPRWTLQIVGDGHEHQSLERMLIRLQLREHVKLVGSVRDVAGHYARASIFVLPSDYEGMPNALLEAMAHGVPCVISNSLPGALEYIEDGQTGLVFRSGDAPHLADRLALLMSNSALRTKLGEAARRKMEPLRIERVLKKWDALTA